MYTDIMTSSQYYSGYTIYLSTSSVIEINCALASANVNEFSNDLIPLKKEREYN